MVGFTWPTKDDEPSSDTEQKVTFKAQQSRNRPGTDGAQSSESRERLEEKITSVPLRMVLFPTEDELSLSQMTPSSSLHNFNQNSNRRGADGGEKLTNLQSEEVWQNRDPQWADQDSKVSFYMSHSPPSPSNSQEFEEKHSADESGPDKDNVWQSFGEESRMALCTEDMGSELEVNSMRYC